MFAEHLHIDHRLVDVTELDGAKQTFDTVDDFETASITQGKNESQTSVARSLLDGFVKLFLRTCG